MEIDTEVSYIPNDPGPGVSDVVIVNITGKAGVTYLLRDHRTRKLTLQAMPLKEFDAQHFVLHVPPSEIAAGLLQQAEGKLKPNILDAIEEVLNMKTQGKSAEAIRAEVLKYAAELPAEHALKSVPKKYPDRQAAIAALTATRAAHFAVTNPKESTMSKKVKATAAVAEAPNKAAAAAPAEVKKDDKKATTKGKSTTTAAMEPAKTTAAPAKATKEAEKLAAKADVKAKTAAKAGRKGAVNLAGPFKLGPKAEKVKSPAELRLHEGSARYALMDYVYGSKKKTFTIDELKAVKGVGDQLKQALSGMVRYEFLSPA